MKVRKIGEDHHQALNVIHIYLKTKCIVYMKCNSIIIMQYTHFSTPVIESVKRFSEKYRART